MKPLTEFTDAQKVALELYLKVDEDYKPPSFTQLSKDLFECAFNASSSTLQRWAKSCDFEEYLKQHINALILADDKNNADLDTAAGEENFKRTLLSLADNNELVNASFSGLKKYMKQVLEKESMSKDEAKLFVQIYSISSGRDDKLLDRKTFLDATDKLTKADLMKELAGTSIDVEEIIKNKDDALDADLEIED